MPDFSTTLPEGKTATSKDGSKRMIVRGGVWVTDETYIPPAKREKTSPQDRTAMAAHSAKAASERDAQRTYAAAARSIEDFGSGPVANAYYDAILPDEDGGVMDRVGAILGTPLRALTSNRTIEARDHLKTIGANVALAGSQQMKGSSSDKDTALMRLSGMGPSKTVKENQRILKEASFNAGLEQTRSLMAARWIGQYGSLTAPSANGMTYEQALQKAERRYTQAVQARRAGIPKAPPRKRGGVQTIDINGRPIR